MSVADKAPQNLGCSRASGCSPSPMRSPPRGLQKASAASSRAFPGGGVHCWGDLHLPVPGPRRPLHVASAVSAVPAAPGPSPTALRAERTPKAGKGHGQGHRRPGEDRPAGVSGGEVTARERGCGTKWRLLGPKKRRTVAGSGPEICTQSCFSAGARGEGRSPNLLFAGEGPGDSRVCDPVWPRGSGQGGPGTEGRPEGTGIGI